jgi:hypothetical protein|eukprot:COSAG05_NODE_11896_length_491_cov_0.923469_1_plen_78_part_00
MSASAVPKLRLHKLCRTLLDVCALFVTFRLEQLEQEAKEAERKKLEFVSQQADDFEEMQSKLVEDMEKQASQMQKKE